MHYLRELGGWKDRRTGQQLIRDENLKSMFKLLSENREISRSDMSKLSGLSPTTVSALVDEMLREGLVVEVGYARTLQSGRKPINLQVNASGRQIPVFDLSSDGVHYTLYNLALEEQENCFVPVPGHGLSADEPSWDACRELGERYIDAMREILGSKAKLFSAEKALVLCISHPGFYLSRMESFFLNALRVSIRRESLDRFEEELGLPIYIGSNAQSMAYSEMRHQEAAGNSMDELVYVAVGSDVGTGFVTEGSVRETRNHFPGELGHVSIDYRGRKCPCGARGCLEQYVNVEAMAARVQQVVDFHSSKMLAKDGAPITLEMIGRAYDAGEKAIVDTINDVAAQLFTGIYSMMCVTGICRVFIGGGIERLGEGFLKELRRLSDSVAMDALMKPVQLEYGHIDPKDAGKGIARYYLDKVFEIGRRRA